MKNPLMYIRIQNLSPIESIRKILTCGRYRVADGIKTFSIENYFNKNAEKFAKNY